MLLTAGACLAINIGIGFLIGIALYWVLELGPFRVEQAEERRSG
jgi:hypothetical protein